MRFLFNAIRALACFRASFCERRRACLFRCLFNCAATFLFFAASFLANCRAVFRWRAFCCLNSLAAACFLCFFCLILSFLRYAWRRVLDKCLLRANSSALRLALACLSARALRILDILAFSFRLSIDRCFAWRANILFLSAFFFFAEVRRRAASWAAARLSDLCLTFNSFDFLIYSSLTRFFLAACDFASLACAALLLAAAESLLLFRLRLPRPRFPRLLPLRPRPLRPLRSLRVRLRVRLRAAFRLRARCLRAFLARVFSLRLFLAMVFCSSSFLRLSLSFCLFKLARASFA